MVDRPQDEAFPLVLTVPRRYLAGASLLLRFGRIQLCGAGAVGRVGAGRLVHALLHALHDQVQQRGHGVLHVLPGRGARLEVRDATEKGKALPEGLLGQPRLESLLYPWCGNQRWVWWQ